MSGQGRTPTAATYQCHCGFTFTVEPPAALARYVPAHTRVCATARRNPVNLGPQPTPLAAVQALLQHKGATR